jgi:hypothetical protein
VNNLETATSEIRKFEAAHSAKLRIIIATCEGDICSTWWEICAVFVLASDARDDSAFDSNYHYYTYTANGVTYCEMGDVVSFDSDLSKWNDEKFRGPVVRFGNELANRLAVPFFCPPVNCPSLRWWEKDHLDEAK